MAFVRALWEKYELQINRKKLKRITLGCRELCNFKTMCLLHRCFCDMKWQGAFHVNYLLFHLCFYGLLRYKNSMLYLYIVFETVRTPELNKDDTKGHFEVDGGKPGGLRPTQNIQTTEENCERKRQYSPGKESTRLLSSAKRSALEQTHKEHHSL